MCVDTGVAGSAGKRLSIAVGDVLASLRVSVAFGEPEVNYVNLSFLSIDAHEKIVGFHITMEEILRVHIFNASDHLLTEHADSFEREFAAAVLEKIFEGLAE